MFKKSTLLSAFVAVALSASLGVAGFWNNSFPKVGGAAYSCGSVNSVSNCTVPAGPASITGNETVPMDTNLANGANPQTVIASTTTLANYARGTGLLYATGVGVTGIAGTGEQTLATYTLPANTLKAGRMLKIKGSFTSAGNGNNKTFKCYFGASVISSGTITDSSKNGECNVVVTYTAAATQTVYANMIHDTTAITGYVNLGTDDSTTALTLKLTGQGGTSGVDVTMNAFSVELLGQ